MHRHVVHRSGLSLGALDQLPSRADTGIRNGASWKARSARYLRCEIRTLRAYIWNAAKKAEAVASQYKVFTQFRGL
jgi:hypothetical protein